jgi:hypothetical protein
MNKYCLAFREFCETAEYVLIKTATIVGVLWTVCQMIRTHWQAAKALVHRRSPARSNTHIDEKDPDSMI